MRRMEDGSVQLRFVLPSSTPLVLVAGRAAMTLPVSALFNRLHSSSQQSVLHDLHTSLTQSTPGGWLASHPLAALRRATAVTSSSRHDVERNVLR